MDIDLKLVYGYEYEDEVPMMERMLKAKKIIDSLCHELNTYFFKNHTLFNFHGSEPVGQPDGQFFYVWHPAKDAPLYSIFYVLKWNGLERRIPLIDLYIPTNTTNPTAPFHYMSFITDPILSVDNGPFYIPINNLFGINYATLGYLIWDISMMIEFQLRTKGDKLERYMRKYSTVINALSHPEKYMSCFQMHGFAKKCSKEERCDANDRIKRYIKRGILSPNYEQVYRELHPTYLCNWLDRLKHI